MGSPVEYSTISATTFLACASVSKPFRDLLAVLWNSWHTDSASFRLVCLVERLVRVPSGVVKQQYQYGEFGLRVSDDMRIKQVGTIVGTFYGVRQVLMCLFSNIIGYLGVLNRYEGSIPFTRSTFLSFLKPVVCWFTPVCSAETGYIPGNIPTSLRW